MWSDVLSGVAWSIGAGLVAGVVALFARIPPIHRRYERRRDTLRRIADEFQPNGGESMFDRVGRTERNVARIGEKLGVPIEGAPRASR